MTEDTNVVNPIVDTPVVDTPVVDTPVVDTPVVDTPVVDTPVVDTPVVGSNVNVVATKIVSDVDGNEKLMVTFSDGTIINYNL